MRIDMDLEGPAVLHDIGFPMAVVGLKLSDLV